MKIDSVFSSKEYYVIENNQVTTKKLTSQEVYERNHFNQFPETHLKEVARKFCQLDLKDVERFQEEGLEIRSKLKQTYSKTEANEIFSVLKNRIKAESQGRKGELQKSHEQDQEFSATDNNSLRIDYYTFEKIDERFTAELERLKNLPQFSDVANFEFNEELKTKAKELAVNAKRYWPAAAEKINEKLQFKMHGRLPDENELLAKLYGLALRVQLEAFLHTSAGVLPQQWEASKFNKQAPHTKLFGEAVVLQSVMNQNPRLSLAEQGHKLTLVYGQLLGEGTFNVATSAYHIEGGGRKQVARELKTGVQNQNVLREWSAEADRHKQLIDLQIPGIVKLHAIYAANQPGGKVGMILEQCDGDLRELKGKLDEGAQIAAMQQIFTSLIALHKEGLSHEDLKLDNIFFNQKPNGEIETKVGDFGFLSPVGQVVRRRQGTLMYTPIEALLSNVLISAEKDCWAAGLIAYELRHNHGVYTMLPSNLNQRYTQILVRARDLDRYITHISQQVKDNPRALIIQIWQSYASPELRNSLLLKYMYEGKYPPNIDSIRNEIINKFLYPQVEAIFKEIGQSLENGDNYDRMIAGLLRPNPAERISLKQALAEIS